ncbi:MAG TPA: hypothetical protein VF638_14290 [Sphingomonas sp.]|jgi:hypothetical protein
MTIKQMVTTGLTFTQAAVLVPAGTLVSVDTSTMDLSGKPQEEEKVEKQIGLVSAKDYQPAPVIVMGAIAPTGPNPTAPQQLAPGNIQTVDGYADADGTVVVGEGSVQAAEVEVEEGGTPTTRRKRADPLS